jgi:hypothetical protein
MRISNALWISGFLTIGVAINFSVLPANASTSLSDRWTQATETAYVNDVIAPYRGSGR